MKGGDAGAGAGVPSLRSADLDANVGTMMQLRMRYLLNHLERGQAGMLSQNEKKKKKKSLVLVSGWAGVL